MEYHGSCLNEAEKKFYEKLIDAYRRRLVHVKAYDITNKESFTKCLSAVQYDYPEFFYVEFSHYVYVAYDDGWEYRPKYRYSIEETAEIQNRINAVIRKIVDGFEKRGMKSVYQKCAYIHAYLVRNCTYDHAAIDDAENRPGAYTIEGPLLDKTGVCQGIALAYRLICMSCGIEAIAVRGVSFRPGTTKYEGHAWNIVRVGNSAAQIDTTWDMCVTQEGWPIRYDYFFLPDIEMMRDHQYVGYPICRKMGTSYFEKSQSQFSEIKEIDTFVSNVFDKNKEWDKPGTYYFSFKMVNRKETEEFIQGYVEELLRRSTNKGYLYTYSVNSAQSVFTYKIEIKK